MRLPKLPRGLQFGVWYKISLGLILSIAFGVIAMLSLQRSLIEVQASAQRLGEAEAPLEAAYGMALSLDAIGIAVLNYLSAPEPRYRERAMSDNAEFTRHYATHLRLSRPGSERERGQRIGYQHAHLYLLGHALMDRRDAQEAMFARVQSDIARFDRLVDRQLQPQIQRQWFWAESKFARGMASSELESDAAGLGLRLASFQRAPSTETRRAIFDQLSAFERSLKRYRGYKANAKEQRIAASLQQLSREMSATLKQAVVTEDGIRQDRAAFVNLRGQLDKMLDDQRQALSSQATAAIRDEAERTAARMLDQSRIMIPLYVLAACSIGALLAWWIAHPLKALAAGEVRTRDSLTALRAAITRREQAERQREARLAQLRSSEASSAMSALMTGLAYEAHKPLSGISTTLDAMSGRLDEHAAYGGYRSLLRGDLERLGRLMDELLEYGRPPSVDLAPAALLPALVSAVEHCRPLAERLGCRIMVEQPVPIDRVAQNKLRLVRLFSGLLEHGLQRSREGGIVRIKITPAREVLDCRVMDSGQPYHPADLEHLFDPFFAPRGEQAGLSLAMFRRIADEHGGQLSAENRPEGGAVLSVRLPVAGAGD